MNQLYPIIRRVRRPLVAFEDHQRSGVDLVPAVRPEAPAAEPVVAGGEEPVACCVLPGAAGKARRAKGGKVANG